MPFLFLLFQKIFNRLTCSTTRFEEQDVTGETDPATDAHLSDKTDLRTEPDAAKESESHKINTLKKQTLAMLLEGKTEEALTVLVQARYNPAILVMARFRSVEKGYNNKLISFKEFDLELNRINHTIVEMVNAQKTYQQTDSTLAELFPHDFQRIEDAEIFEMIESGQTELAIACCQFINTEYYILLNARYHSQRNAFGFGNITQADWDILQVHIHYAIKEIVTTYSRRKK